MFGMVPKMAVLVASIPQFVLGGAGLVMVRHGTGDRDSNSVAL